MEVLGRKAKGLVISSFIGGVFAAGIGVAFLIVLFTVFYPNFQEDSGFNFIYIMAIVPGLFVLFGILSIVRGIGLIKVPTELVFADANHIKLAFPERNISLNDVEAVIGENRISFSRDPHGFTSTHVSRHGNLVVITRDGVRHVQKHVGHVKEVATILNNRVIRK